MKPLWIKWYPVNWLHSTARDEMGPAQRATFQDFVCLSAISKTPGSFKFVNTESLSRMLNTPQEIIEETIKVCFDRKRISIRDDAEGRVMKILKWKIYQSFTSVDNKTEKGHLNVNGKSGLSSLLSTSNSSDLRGGVGEGDLESRRAAAEAEFRREKEEAGMVGFALEGEVERLLKLWDANRVKADKLRKERFAR